MEIHSPQSYLDRAQRLLAQEQYAEAFRYAQKALEIDPNFAPALQEMGKILERNNQWDDSLSCYEAALLIDPRLWECRWRMGLIYDRKGFRELAFHNFQLVMASVPELFPPEEHLKLAEAFLQQQNPLAAIDATKFCDQLPAGLQVKARAQILLEEIDNAITTLAKIQEIDANFNTASEYTNLARLALKYNQPDRALSLVQNALTLQPDLVEAHFYLALTFATIGKFREAFFSFQELISIAPNYAPAYYEMGILSAKLSKWEEAEAFFQAGRTLDPHIYPQIQATIDRVNQVIKEQKMNY